METMVTARRVSVSACTNLEVTSRNCAKSIRAAGVPSPKQKTGAAVKAPPEARRARQPSSQARGPFGKGMSSTCAQTAFSSVPSYRKPSSVPATPTMAALRSSVPPSRACCTADRQTNRASCRHPDAVRRPWWCRSRRSSVDISAAARVAHRRGLCTAPSSAAAAAAPAAVSVRAARHASARSRLRAAPWGVCWCAAVCSDGRMAPEIASSSRSATFSRELSKAARKPRLQKWSAAASVGPM
mmetsp:Transcript_31086/g.103907  ORF Transcript_31086/g.103907 Transcript_31086/m.103907 type:complete len:242 (-) Transcript_31086:1626-2351(-)